MFTVEEEYGAGFVFFQKKIENINKIWLDFKFEKKKFLQKNEIKNILTNSFFEILKKKKKVFYLHGNLFQKIVHKNKKLWNLMVQTSNKCKNKNKNIGLNLL